MNVKNLIPMSAHMCMDNEPCTQHITVRSEWFARTTTKVRTSIVRQLVSFVRSVGMDAAYSNMSSVTNHEDRVEVEIQMICHPEYIDLLGKAMSHIIHGIVSIRELQDMEQERYYEKVYDKFENTVSTIRPADKQDEETSSSNPFSGLDKT